MTKQKVYFCSRCREEHRFVAKYSAHVYYIVDKTGDIIKEDETVVIEGPIETYCIKCSRAVELRLRSERS